VLHILVIDVWPNYLSVGIALCEIIGTTLLFCLFMVTLCDNNISRLELQTGLANVCV